MAIHSNRGEKNDLAQIIKRNKWNKIRERLRQKNTWSVRYIDRQNFPDSRCCIGYKADIKRESQACLIFREDFGIGSRGVSSIVDSMH